MYSCVLRSYNQLSTVLLRVFNADAENANAGQTRAPTQEVFVFCDHGL